MILNKMPTYSQAPIKKYLETGKFENHTPEPIGAEDSKKMTEEFALLSIGVMSMDNGPEDENKADGIIESNGFLGRSKIEFENIGDDYTKVHGYGRIGNDESGATLYARQTPEAMDLVVVGTDEGTDSGVIHLDQVDPSKSFMTLSPESLGFIAGS